LELGVDCNMDNNSKISKALWYLLIVLLLPCLTLLLMMLWNVPSRLDPQGGANGACQSTQLDSVFNGKGLVATAHSTFCDTFDASEATYVYVHEVGRADSSHSLVFRYLKVWSVGYVDKPIKMIWDDANTLRIVVGDVSEVTKFLSEKDKVKINYEIGKEVYPRSTWDNRVKKEKRYALFEGLVCIVLLFLLIFAIKKVGLISFDQVK
jgi:hypothetical protein